MSKQRSDAEVEQLVSENINLARFFAQKWAYHYGENEAFSMAMEGLWQAAKDWKQSKVPFGAYASLRIRWWMPKAKKSAECKRRGSGTAIHVQLDSPVGDDGSQTIGELLADPNAREAGHEAAIYEDSENISKLIERLDDRTREIICRRFGLNGYAKETLDAVGERVGLTQERIRQIEEVALKKLRRMKLASDAGDKSTAKVTVSKTMVEWRTERKASRQVQQ